ncbi:hypothetical protein R9C00_26345 [Flammeovirgaceae bacterium SG7u.111]|nr:hypothetical protein [Flammeovirgaceae bacterium SG7u.132]WPO35220.1 hypothetical protein R9C00_26345 [Flammeovirgaceae bacterium SG7u.111]
MNTKILMISSAFTLGMVGIALSFLPAEIAQYLNIGSDAISALPLQLLSSLYLGFAILNWMAKDNLIGGIYSRPVAIGNMTHFIVGALALIKMVTNIQSHREIVIALTVIYAIFGICYGYVFMTTPSQVGSKK